MGLAVRFTAPFATFLNPLSLVFVSFPSPSIPPLSPPSHSFFFRSLQNETTRAVGETVDRINREEERKERRKKREWERERERRDRKEDESTENSWSESENWSAGGVLRSKRPRVWCVSAATKIGESRFTAIPAAAFQDESLSRRRAIPWRGYAGVCPRSATSYLPDRSARSASWDTSNAGRSLSPCPRRLRSNGWHEVSLDRG